ncbi:MAG TPA: hypothetical protein VFE46_06835 [Pirellulales bacterium]|nr:hypothetical protein [Pirellulales bacterium]
MQLFTHFLEKNSYVAQEFNQVDVCRGLRSGRPGCRCTKLVGAFPRRLGFELIEFFWRLGLLFVVGRLLGLKLLQQRLLGMQ